MKTWVKVVVPVGAAVCAAAVALPVLAMSAIFSEDPTAALVSCSSPASSESAVTTTAAGLTASQRLIAGQVIGVADADPGLGKQAAVLGLMGALQESNLTNEPPGVGGGGSVGIFQQISSDGWGTVAEEEDPPSASQMFFGDAAWMNPNKGLKQVAGWQTMAPTVAVQSVQGSAFPTAYAKWQPLAEELVGNAQSDGNAVAVDACEPTPGAIGGVTLPTGVTLPSDVLAGIAAAPAPVQQAIQFALNQVGKPYVWGGTGPNGYDCSGLTQAAYGAAGIALPRTTYDQVNVGRAVPQTQLEPGDLVFPDPGHVQIFLGGGLIVEAPHTGAFVQVVPMWGFWQARRVV